MMKSEITSRFARYQTLSLLLLFPLLLVLLRPASAQVSFFRPPVIIPNGGAAQFQADFNGDGIPDILFPFGALALGNGDGTFTPGPTVSASPVAVADFNGDGKPDILEIGPSYMEVLLGNGDGTFQPPVTTNVVSSMGPWAVADVNGDGKADLVGVQGSTLFVFLSNGNGSFSGPTTYTLTLPAGDQVSVVTLADVNGDGNVDIVLSLSGPGNATAPGQEQVFLGNGSGSFASAPVLSTGILFPFSVVVGDFNGDGIPDLGISSTGTSQPTADQVVSILYGNGDGSFKNPTTAFAGLGSLTAANLTGSGTPDLILQGSAMLSVYSRQSSGAYSLVSRYASGGPPVIADFNSDQIPDIATGDSLLVGLGKGYFLGNPAIPVPAVGTDSCYVAGDFSGTGFQDVAVASGTQLSISLNSQGKVFEPGQTVTLAQPCVSIATADLNGDGKLDLLLTTAQTGSSSWSYIVLLGNGDGTFGTPSVHSFTSTQQSTYPQMVVSDFNKDKIPDFAVSGVSSAGVAVFLGKGDGTFSAPAYYYAGTGAGVIEGDFNGDGIPDLESGNAILFGKGDGTFQSAQFPTALANTVGLFGAADLTANGRDDLVGSNGNVFLSNGDGTFTALPAQKFGFLTALTDVNGDKLVDAVGTDAGYSYGCAVFVGAGDGTFNFATQVEPSGNRTGAEPNCVAAADLNNDGKPDLLVADPNSGTLSALFNMSSPQAAAPAASLLPTAIDFGNQDQGTTGGPQTVTLTDTGTQPLTISSISITGTNSSEFAETSTCGGSLDPGTDCFIRVTFSPSQTGSQTATLAIADNAAGSPQTVPLSGTGAQPGSNLPSASVLPASLNFSQQFVGTRSNSQSVTLQNTGNSAVTISGVASSSAAFSLVNGCGASLAAGATCSIGIYFTAAAAGTTTGTLTISDNASNSPQVVSLAGTAEDFTIAATGSASASVNAGQTASFQLALTPVGGFNQAVALSCSGAPALTSCTVTPATATLNGSSASTVTATLTTTAASDLPPGNFEIPPYGGAGALLFGLLALLGLLPWALRRRLRLPRPAVLLASTVLLLALALAACGGGSSSGSTGNNGTSVPGTKAGTYPLTITATFTSGSETITHNTTVSVTVQ